MFKEWEEGSRDVAAVGTRKARVGKEKALEGERGRDEQEEVKGGDVGPGFSNQGIALFSGFGCIQWGVAQGIYRG